MQRKQLTIFILYNHYLICLLTMFILQCWKLLDKVPECNNVANLKMCYTVIKCHINTPKVQNNLLTVQVNRLNITFIKIYYLLILVGTFAVNHDYSNISWGLSALVGPQYLIKILHDTHLPGIYLWLAIYTLHPIFNYANMCIRQWQVTSTTFEN